MAVAPGFGPFGMAVFACQELSKKVVGLSRIQELNEVAIGFQGFVGFLSGFWV